VRGKAGIFLQRTPTVAIFKFPVLISSTPAGASQLGVGGGGGGGGADLGGSGQARAIRWAFFSNFPTA